MTDAMREAVEDALWDCVDEGTFEYSVQSESIINKMTSKVINAMGELRVKPLAWVYDAGWFEANNGYSIQAEPNDDAVMWQHNERWCRTVYGSVEAAKGAAQAHHNAACMANMMPVPMTTLQAENAKLREAADGLADAVHNEAAARGNYIAIKPDRGGATGPKGKARHKWFVSRCAVSDALTAYCSTQSETTALSGQDAEGET